MARMKQIGVRELRQNASQWLREVADGESHEVTVRGTPVALLGPLPAADDPIARLAARGLSTQTSRGSRHRWRNLRRCPRRRLECRP